MTSLEINFHDRIDVNPDILVGKPVIKGTRLAVDFIVELVSNGWTDRQIVENYTGITVDDIRACVAYKNCGPN